MRGGAVVYHPLVGRLALRPICRWGMAVQRRTGTTPSAAYRAFRKLYGNKNGSLFRDLRSAAFAAGPPLLDLPDEPNGVAAGSVERALAALDRDGYVVLDRNLPAEACDQLEAVARDATCTIIGGGPNAPARARWDSASPWSVRYNVDEEDVLRSSATQQLLADESLLAIAQGHLGHAPVQDMVAMWWSAVPGPTTAVDTDAAAQEFHFDLDRFAWLKLFVLLTDVDEDTGPHVYARGSHRHQPDALRRDGRMPDEQVEAAYPGDIVHLGGPRGTMLLVDTAGLHKGLALRRGHRLMFQVEWATSLFGAPYVRPRLDAVTPELRSAAARHPWTFQRFDLGDT